MTLYHFTARRFLPGVRAEGLTRGCIPVSVDPPRLIRGYQWLTTNPSFAQEWAEGTGRLPYRRDEVRLTVEIPDSERHHLLDRFGWSLATPLARDLCAFGDSDNWFVFSGDIPPEWIVGTAENAERAP